MIKCDGVVVYLSMVRWSMWCGGQCGAVANGAVVNGVVVNGVVAITFILNCEFQKEEQFLIQ